MTQIDLSLIAPPDVIESFDFETILEEISEYLVAAVPDLADDLARESSLASIIAQAMAYRELLVRQRVNDGARAVMLASATGADLDNLGALFGVERLVIDPGDPAAIPPVEPTLEADGAFRARVQIAPESWTSAGSIGAYKFHAISADGDVLDVGVVSPAPGDVTVTVLSRTGQGTASTPLLSIVDEALNADDVRPLCDTVTVQSAVIQTYEITATLYFEPGPDRALVLAEAQAAAQAYADARHRIGHDVTLSGVYAALHRVGVQKVTPTAPAADLVIDDTSAAYCTAITLTDGGISV